ncbi:MAG: Ig-like domain-containing protein [Bacteroidales bacterium]|nr:Ig-like domain-containing protein [Bacteroidales bacterium]
MIFRYIVSFFIAVLLWNCAQQGSPSGGPRDEDPPRVIESEPANYSTRFDANEILITFDEFIVLDNVNRELIVSPPMEEKPEIKLRKKTIIIQFEEILKENTTYTFNFGSSIKDLHEGNKLLNFEYVFATGDVLDSMSVKGTLKFAEDLSVPEYPISIMLYNDLSDSVPLIDIPLYVGRSDDSGVFSVNNLRPDVYKVFALNDGNYNLLFDLPTEEIGFLDSSLIVNAEFARSILEAKGLLDSTEISSDTLLMPVDTTGMSPDSLVDKGPDLNSIYIDILLFTEETEIQYITDYSRSKPWKIRMMFAKPLTDTFHYRLLPVIPDDTIGILEYFTPGRDTLTLWIRDSLDYKRDTLMMEVNFTVKDTTHQYITKSDTLVFSYREKKRKKKKEETEEKDKLVISTIRNKGEHDLNRNLAFDLNVPLKEINDSLIGFYMTPDSVEVPEPFQTGVDTSLLTRGWLSADWESQSQYRMVLLPGAISGIYPLEHDTIDISFKTRDIEYYGQILLTLENVRNRILIQLLSRDKVIRKQIVDTPGLYTFSYLIPQEYQIKFIHDLNGNGKWDTGNYLKKLQPEPVEFLPVKVTVRSNWDHDVTMTLEK